MPLSSSPGGVRAWSQGRKVLPAIRGPIACRRRGHLEVLNDTRQGGAVGGAPMGERVIPDDEITFATGDRLPDQVFEGLCIPRLPARIVSEPFVDVAMEAGHAGERALIRSRVCQ